MRRSAGKPKGVMLADEVGLGKTIEAALVLSQRWWERQRHLLLIVPASLRKQWSTELREKFSLPSVILDAKRVKDLAKAGKTNPLGREEGILILSYEYASRIADQLRQVTDVLPVIKTQVATIRDLNDDKMVKRIVADALAIHRSKSGLFSDLTEERAEAVVKEFCAAFVAKVIAIPSLTVTPQDQVSFGFQPFQLDIGSWNYQPLSRELLVQVLRTEKQTVISGEEGGDVPARLEDHLVAKLIDFDEIDYDAHAGLLYDLAG